MSYVVDAKFILAILERWKLETHSFHLPTNECFITLENVYMLLDLPFIGKAIYGKTNLVESISKKLLGYPLRENYMRAKGMKLVWLKILHNCMVLTEKSIEKKTIKTRIFIMLLICLFPFLDTSNYSIHIMYLHLSCNIDKIGS